jgi:hypothetical protein
MSGPDRRLADQAYAETIRNVASFSAMVANDVLLESKQLRRRLKTLIALNRLNTLFILSSIAAGIFWSPWVLLAICIAIVVNIPVDRRQKAANIELASTIEVFMEMMAADEDFRTRSIELIRQQRGDDAATAVDDLCARRS